MRHRPGGRNLEDSTTLALGRWEPALFVPMPDELSDLLSVRISWNKTS
jgi:hypothetical protein